MEADDEVKRRGEETTVGVGEPFVGPNVATPGDSTAGALANQKGVCGNLGTVLHANEGLCLHQSQALWKAKA
jgi:hypothetical protein